MSNAKKALRDVKKALRKFLKEMIGEAIVGVAEEALSNEDVWVSIDKIIKENLEQSSCWIDFYEGMPLIVVDMGSGDNFHHFSEFDLTTDKTENVKDQILGMNKLIGRLEEAKKKLELKP